MTCERARELFGDYLEGRADGTLTAAVRDHVSQCASCKREFELFRQTWYALSDLPEIESPSDLRHDVVMQVASQQHESLQRVRQSFWGVGGALLSGRHVFARAAVAGCAAAALAVVLFTGPQPAYEYFKGMFSPGIVLEQNHQSAPDAITSHPLSQLSAERKRQWQARKVRRNTVWVTIEPSENGDGTALYKVMLSINENALLPNEVTARIGATVYLMPSGEFSPDAVSSARAVWEGSILKSSPVLVPVIVDRSQGRAGTVNLIVTWRFRHRDFAHIIFIPTRGRTSYAGNPFEFPVGSPGYASAGADVYSSLCGMARDYGVPIVVRSGLTMMPSAIDLGGATLDEALRQTLKPIGLDWLYADSAVYVEKRPVEVSQ